MGRRKSRLPKVIALAIVGLGVWGATANRGGCDRSGAARSNKAIVLNPTTRTTPPATQSAAEVAPPTVAASATSKPGAATRAADKPSSHMTINNVLVPFPEAKLLL